MHSKSLEMSEDNAGVIGVIMLGENFNKNNFRPTKHFR